MPFARRRTPQVRRIALRGAEDQLQALVVEWMDVRGLLFCHCKNSGRKTKLAGARDRILGLRAGVPDLLVFTPSPLDGRPTALELKAVAGTGRPSPAQKAWLAALTECGWTGACCNGITEALAFLTARGYADLRPKPLAQPMPPAKPARKRGGIPRQGRRARPRTRR